MTRCLDEVQLQSYFDGELSLDMMETVTSHLGSCATCAAAARELEAETAFVTAALAAEFEASVPTERLRQRIDAAVLGDRIAVAQASEKRSGWAGFFSGLLNFGTQRTLGYASLALMLAFGAIFGVVKLRDTSTPVVTPHDQRGSLAVNSGEQKGSTGSEQVQAPAPIVNSVITPIQQVAYKPAKNPRASKVGTTPARNQEPVKLLPGERSYLQTIARLDSTIKSNKTGMRPSLQVEYERNLAVVDRAIAATRSAAKSNPNDPDAADFMFAAYQSKVDLLNTIADARVGGRGH